MTSPSTAITIDGPTAWLVVECPPDSAPARWEQADKQCDTCNGVGWLTWTYLTKPGTKTFDCTDCHGTGRFTFTLDVECDDSIHLPFVPDLADDDPWYVPGDRECRQCDESGTYQLSVHVGEVLPIHGATEHWPDATHLSLDEGNRTVWLWTWTGQGFDFTRDYCTLSADAASGMYAVRLAIHKGET
jgi:hypothetical protein